MKVELPSLGVQTYIKDYTISKKIDDFGVVVELDTKAVFDKENGYALLLENTAQGNTKEPATITIPCGTDNVEIEGYILHNEGKVNLKSCRMEKSVKFSNPIECIIDKEINVFDYVPSTTDSVQGEIEARFHNEVKLIALDLLDTGELRLDLAYLLSLMAPIPDYTNEGYFEHYKTVFVTFGFDASYQVVVSVTYYRNSSSIQHTPDWLPLTGTANYYLPLNPIEWNSPVYNSLVVDTEIFTFVNYTAGIKIAYKDIPISNTFLVNEIFEDIFSCTGIDLISNFFNINADNTNPSNSEYDFAADYLQSMKIAQSFDIIRESAIEDSFGKSGKFSAKQMILEFNRLFNLILIYDSVFDVMRWEHVSYFESKGVDFEAQGIAYEFSDDADINKDQINIEAWLMAQPSPTDGFYSTKIDYQNYQLNTEINEVSKKSDKFMTDLFGCLNNVLYEGDAYKKLFFLLSTDGGNVIGLNRSMSMRSLVENLHYRNRPLKTGKHDGNDVVFSGYSIGLEAEISFFGSFKVFNKINPSNTVKLNVNGIGTWLISEMEIEDKKITLKIKK